MGSGGALSGKFWNRVADDIYEEHTARVESLTRDLLADGFPPFHVPTNDRARLGELQRLKLSDSQYFWGSPQAQAELASLEARYGGG